MAYSPKQVNSGVVLKSDEILVFSGDVFLA